MLLIKRKIIFTVIIVAVFGYIFTTGYVERNANHKAKQLIESIKLDTPAILSINYSKLTASPLTLYNNTIALKNIVIVFKDQPDNPLVIGQLSLISAKYNTQHKLEYLKFAFEDVHFSHRFERNSLPAALLQYGFFQRLARYLNGKSAYFYGRFTYDAKAKQVQLVNQITLEGANYYRAQERLNNFNFELPKQPTHLGALLNALLQSATKSQLEQYSVKVRIPNFTVPKSLQRTLPYYIDRNINNSEFIGRFSLYNKKETNQLIFRKEGKEILRARIRQSYKTPPLFSYGRPPPLVIIKVN